jgi:PEP-CTERM motif
MKHNRKFLMTVMGATLILAGTARASFIFDFQSVTPLGGGQFSYLYNLDFGSNGGAEELLATDFATLFDIVGFVSASAPAGFTTSSQLTGILPPFQSPPDSATLMNVTYRYTGSPITTNMTFTGFTIVSTSNSTQAGFTSGQDTAIQDGMTKLGDTSGTTVPGVQINPLGDTPEPATMGLFGMSLLLLGALRLRPTTRQIGRKE